MGHDATSVASLSDYHALGLTLWAEGRNQSVDGRIATGYVIRERLMDPRWPKTVRGVCLQPSQFSCWNDGNDANHTALMKLAVLFLQDYVSASAIPLLLKECLFIGEGILDRRWVDHTNRANHYLTTQLFTTDPPTWAQHQTPTAVIGDHVFLRL